MPETNFTMLVHNRPVLTEQALDSLEGTAGANFTLYGDAPELQTADIARYWRTGSPSRRWYMDSPSVGTGAARNRVIRFSEVTFGRGDYLYLSDSDVFFHHNWLTYLIDCYEAAWEYGCRVIGAYNHPYHQPVEGIVKVGEYGVNQVQALALQSMLMRWEVWDKYGPFCETPVGKVCQGEDVDFTNRIVADGGTLGVVSPALLVNTGITNSFGEKIPGWELVKQQCPAWVICE